MKPMKKGTTFFTLIVLHTFFHLIHKFCGFISSAKGNPRTNRRTYNFIDAENMSATQKVNELLKHFSSPLFTSHTDALLKVSAKKAVKVQISIFKGDEKK
jgi:hypothetical protein